MKTLWLAMGGDMVIGSTGVGIVIVAFLVLFLVLMARKGLGIHLSEIRSAHESIAMAKAREKEAGNGQ